MRTKNLLWSLLIAAGIALVPAASQADSRVSIGVAVGPPPPPVVMAPAPAPGYVWAPGYWAWNGYRHVWVEGYWMAVRPGYAWVPDRWERRGPRWHHVHGHWNPRHTGRGFHGGHRH
jgi:hypothetical protein